jgi:hypothetical protein
VVLAVNLLSDNDFHVLRKAMVRGEEISLERTLEDVSVSAKTCCVAAPWTVSMVLQIRMAKGKFSWIQNFENVEEARRRLDVWDKRFHWLLA